MTNSKTPNDIDLKMYAIDMARQLLHDTIADNWDTDVSKEFFALVNKIYNFLVK